MLVKYLGFDAADVEMCYYDSNRNERLRGQDAPTATNFKTKFSSLLSSASARNVRFVYVDAHGTTNPGEDGAGGEGNDGGWVLAQDDAGASKEVVSGDWLSETIRTVSTTPRVHDSTLSHSSELEVACQPHDPDLVLHEWRYS
jgi:hypothetical protein